jgi:type II secretory pathway pseudopilin PulG
LVELLVVIAIIGVLVGMSLPAMQNMRELSRRSDCEQNLVRISLGLSAYATRNGHYPAGSLAPSGPIRNEAVGYHHNWISALLPLLDAANVYNAIDQNRGVYDSANAEVRNLRLPMLLCPSASNLRENTTCYSGIHASTETPIDENNDGVFFLNVPVSDHDITDGLGYTLFVGEKLSRWEDDLGWMSGTRSSLRNVGLQLNAERQRIRGPHDPTQVVSPTYVGGLASDHPGGVYLLMGSGEYQFRSASMDHQILQQLASRADGGLPIEWKSQLPLTDTKREVGPSGKTDQAAEVDENSDLKVDAEGSKEPPPE